MGGVTHDLNLAQAVSKAGAMPSLTTDKNFEKDLEIFKNKIGNTNVLFSVMENDVLDLDYINRIVESEIKFVELRRSDIKDLETLNNCSPDNILWYNRQFLKNVEKLKKNNIQIMRRCFKQPINTFDLVDAIGIKGKESAGLTGGGKITIKELIFKQKEKTPDAHLIPLGGISGPEDVKDYLEIGSSAVGVGTLFAASVESCLDITTKQLLVAKNKNDLTIFQDTKQNALVINSADILKNDGTEFGDMNRASSLFLGIQGKGGHIYAGHSIDGVTEIRTVKQVIEYLISGIK